MYMLYQSRLYNIIIDLVQEIQNSFQQKPEVALVTHVFDVKKWMCNHIPNIHDHLKAHQFKFQKDGTGEVKMFYKEWSTDDFWLPQSGMYILQNFSGRIIPIVEAPSLVAMQFDCEKLQKLQGTLLKLAGYLEKCGALSWWDKFMSNANKNVSVHGSPECKCQSYITCMHHLA